MTATDGQTLLLLHRFAQSTMAAAASGSNPYNIKDPAWNNLSKKLYESIFYPAEDKTEAADISDEFAKRAAKYVTERLANALETLAYVYETARLKEVPIANRHETSIGSYNTQTPEQIDAGSNAEARDYTLRVIRDAIAAHKAQEAMSDEISKKNLEMGWDKMDD